jgi:hypothetical protein
MPSAGSMQTLMGNLSVCLSELAQVDMIRALTLQWCQHGMLEQFSCTFILTSYWAPLKAEGKGYYWPSTLTILELVLTTQKNIWVIFQNNSTIMCWLVTKIFICHALKLMHGVYSDFFTICTWIFEKNFLDMYSFNSHAMNSIFGLGREKNNKKDI